MTTKLIQPSTLSYNEIKAYEPENVESDADKERFVITLREGFPIERI